MTISRLFHLLRSPVSAAHHWIQDSICMKEGNRERDKETDREQEDCQVPAAVAAMYPLCRKEENVITQGGCIDKGIMFPVYRMDPKSHGRLHSVRSD